VALQHGSHRAVGDDDPLRQGVQQRLRASGAGHSVDVEREAAGGREEAVTARLSRLSGARGGIGA
jgi:hypothetical protein